AAGHDEFVAPLIERCFGESYWHSLGLSREKFLSLGRVNADDESELFGLTPLALRMCRASNGVSRKHGAVSRELWNKMWPERRVAAYKRWGLILSDMERLQSLLLNPERPVQLVFAGKAHPQDQDAKLILQQMALWELDSDIMRHAVFLQDYDQEIARQLVQSVDVWMNVPRRPLEASGTSGEKVALNGGLNLSVLDGWWL